MLDFAKERGFMGVWWALAWRNGVAMIVAMIVSGFGGGVIGFLVGMVLGSQGVSLPLIKLICGCMGGVLGLGMGFFVSLFPLHMILGKDLGGYKLGITAVP